MIELGQKIAARLLELDMSQAQLARGARLSRPHVNRLVNGRAPNPETSTLVAIAEVIGLHPNDLRLADCDAAEAAAGLLEQRMAHGEDGTQSVSLGGLVDVAARLEDGEALRVQLRDGTLYVARLTGADEHSTSQGARGGVTAAGRW